MKVVIGASPRALYPLYNALIGYWSVVDESIVQASHAQKSMLQTWNPTLSGHYMSVVQVSHA